MRTAASRVSGSSGSSCSPRTRNRVRLVTATFRPGHAATIAASEGRGVDDLLEVVEDEQQPPALEVCDEALLELALAVEEPERARDRADHVAGIPDRLQRHEDDAVRELVRRRRRDRLGEPRLADPAGAGDREQAHVVAAQERGRLGRRSRPARSASSVARSSRSAGDQLGQALRHRDGELRVVDVALDARAPRPAQGRSAPGAPPRARRPLRRPRTRRPGSRAARSRAAARTARRGLWRR